MRKAALKPVWKRKFVHTTDSKHDLPVAANVLDRQFNPVAPNMAYVSDITYIRTGAGWLYLAIVLDLFARKVVGWAMAPSMPAELVCACLEHGHPAAATSPRPDRPFRPRQPVCQRAVPGPAGRTWLRLQHEPQRQLLGQCRRGTLLPESQDGARLAAPICQPRRGQGRHHRLHRRLLQLRAIEFSIGQSAARRLRTENGSKRTYRCVRNYLTTTNCVIGYFFLRLPSLQYTILVLSGCIWSARCANLASSAAIRANASCSVLQCANPSSAYRLNISPSN